MNAHTAHDTRGIHNTHGTDCLRQAELATRLANVRATTLRLIEGLSAEDCMVQSMPDASPVKWHLAHTTWFFETFVLEANLAPRDAFVAFDATFRVLFNSYYNGVGARHPRSERGLLSRPGLDTVLRYRTAIDQQLQDLLSGATLDTAWLDLIELGVHHEQQHQELILTDIKHHLWCNPVRPVWRSPPAARPADAPTEAPAELKPSSQTFTASSTLIGHDGKSFAFDNEAPRHEVRLEPFSLATRLVTNREYHAFMDDGGYRRPELWLSDGWDQVTQHAWSAPLYWIASAAGQQDWRVYTFSGVQDINPDAPVCHVSYYEADACARWLGGRLPTEFEWEHVAARQPIKGNLLESGRLDPRPTHSETGDCVQMYGDVWEWTQSAYLPYPGFRVAPGAVGEYNGKFMINQMVLRGGSCVTPQDHLRVSYRNFFPPHARWQFSGFRVAA